MDKKQCAHLVQLDLSTAFDTVDHTLLLERLSSDLGVIGTALHWFQSYLEDRKQSVTIRGVKSETGDVLWGVPQGSVLGPKLFSIYTKPLGDILGNNDCHHHRFADDIQMYKEFDPSKIDSHTETIMMPLNTVEDVRNWMEQHFLNIMMKRYRSC